MSARKLPPATAAPCNECPWRRAAASGWLGPYSAQKWLDIAHSDSAIACHKTIPGDADGWTADMRQCRGAAIFRANVCKSPRDPAVVTGPVDRGSVFGWNDEFLEHHVPSVGDGIVP